MDKRNIIEESNEETNPFVPLTTIRSTSVIDISLIFHQKFIFNFFEENCNSSSFVKYENQSKPIQRRILSSNDDYQENRRSTLKVNIFRKKNLTEMIDLHCSISRRIHRL